MENKKRIQIRLDELSDQDIINKINKIRKNTNKPLATIVVAILRKSINYIDDNGNFILEIEGKSNDKKSDEIKKIVDEEDIIIEKNPKEEKKQKKNNISEDKLNQILNAANFKEE